MNAQEQVCAQGRLPTTPPDDIGAREGFLIDLYRYRVADFGVAAVEYMADKIHAIELVSYEIAVSESAARLSEALIAHKENRISDGRDFALMKLLQQAKSGK